MKSRHPKRSELQLALNDAHAARAEAAQLRAANADLLRRNIALSTMGSTVSVSPNHPTKMKSIVKTFLPGVLVTLLTLAAGAASIAYAETNQPAAVPSAQPVYLPPAPQPAPLVICGGCGLQIEAARPVLIAQPTPGQIRPAPRDRRQAYQPRPHDHVRDRALDCQDDRAPVIYYVGGMPPDRPAFPRTSYDLPRVQHAEGRWIAPVEYSR